MFHAVRLSGSNDFATIFQSLPIPSNTRAAIVAKFLDVSEASIKLWLSGKRCPPRAAVIALWHESHFGRSVVCAHSEYGQVLARGYAESLERDVVVLKATAEALRAELARLKLDKESGRHVPMNDPVFDLARVPPKRLY